jgi:hypothetical protein
MRHLRTANYHQPGSSSCLVLLHYDTLAGIARGEIQLAFRRWKRPTVRSGGTLLTGAGKLQIGKVSTVRLESITPGEAELAGYSSVEALVSELNRQAAGDVYRIEVLSLREDPRIALRQAPLSASDLSDLRARLTRLDSVPPNGPWTRRVLEAIRDYPGLRAADLCKVVGQDRHPFKANVRELKNLGLTISGEVGYSLSPRGAGYLSTLASTDGEISPDA